MKVKGSTILILLTTLLVAICAFITVVMKVNVPYVVLIIIGGLLFTTFYLGSNEGNPMERNPYWIIIAYFVLGVPFLKSIIPKEEIIIGIVVISCIGTIGYIIYDVVYRKSKMKKL